MATSDRSPTPRKRSMLTGKIIPRCQCGTTVYAEGKCYGHYQIALLERQRSPESHT